MQLVEARLFWGRDLLGVAHVRGPRRISSFGLPFPEDAEVDPTALPRTFLSGALTLHLAPIEGERRTPAAKSDWRIAKGVGLAFVLHATFLAMAFIGRASDAELERAQLEELATLLESQATRVAVLGVQAQPLGDLLGGGVEGETSGLSNAGEEGAMGNPASQRNAGVAKKTHGTKAHAVDPRPEPGAESFGMIALLSENGAGESAGNDSFATHEGPAATGSIFGTTIDDAIGTGGMALSGFGEAGGGPGTGVELARPGTGRGAGSGIVGGYGSSHGRLTGSHHVRSPVLRCGYLDEQGVHKGCDGLMVNGRLPPEAVQRVVRNNFGRLRNCYQAGLQRDPSLEGRIAVKFVIDRAGAVAMASVAERSLNDDEVARCVAHGFESMSFPEPEGGVVTVVYPLVFTSM